MPSRDFFLSLSRTFRIAKNEVHFHFAKRSFTLTVVVAPLILIGLLSFSLQYLDIQSANRVAIVDPGKVLEADKRVSYARDKRAPGQPTPEMRYDPHTVLRIGNLQQAEGLFQQGAIDAFVIVSPDPNEKDRLKSFGKLPVSYLTRNVIAERLIKKRFPEMTKTEVDAALNPFSVRHFAAPEEEGAPVPGKKGALPSFRSAASAREASTFVLGTAVLFAVVSVLVIPFGWHRIHRSVRESRTNRTFEMLLTIAEPRELVGGMIAGSAFVNALHFFLWLGMAFPLTVIAMRVDAQLTPFLMMLVFAFAGQVLLSAFCLLVSVADSAKPMTWFQIVIFQLIFFGTLLAAYLGARIADNLCACEWGTTIGFYILVAVLTFFSLPFLGPPAALYSAALLKKIVLWHYVAALAAVIGLSIAMFFYISARLKRWIYPSPKVTQ